MPVACARVHIVTVNNDMQHIWKHVVEFSIANSEYFILARVHVLLVEFQSSLQVISDVN
jgi:hypothetical protein